MSTNTALDDIKARAEVNQYLGKTASQDEAKDTLKLIAALEAVEALAEYDTWEHHAIGMGEVFGSGYEHALEVVRDVIQDALS